MGFTSSAATAANLLGRFKAPGTMSFAPSAKFWCLLFVLFAFIVQPTATMDGGAAAPGHAWTPGRHIVAMQESGHPAIMDGIFGAPYWRALRPRLIQFLVANYLWGCGRQRQRRSPKHIYNLISHVYMHSS